MNRKITKSEDNTAKFLDIMADLLKLLMLAAASILGLMADLFKSCGTTLERNGR